MNIKSRGMYELVVVAVRVLVVVVWCEKVQQWIYAIGNIFGKIGGK